MKKLENLGLSLILAAVLGSVTSGQAPQVQRPAGLLPGQSRTLLPDGRTLIAGGTGQSGPQDSLTIRGDATSDAIWTGSLARARAWHTATVLPQGTVLVLGGVDANGVVDTAEVLDPTAPELAALSTPAPSPRAYHTTTVLSDSEATAGRA